MTTTLLRTTKRISNFDDLHGLRAECYVRDSTPDQENGFGPEIQRHNEERFAQSYGLILGKRWYTEFVSGRKVDKRYEFQKVIEDARLDLFDVLLVDHTSRFGRNQAECIRYKEELQGLNKTVIFVSQGIISGSDRDFISERINETIDEGYSRNLSRYVSEGLIRKVEHGLHIGPAPFGYKSELIAGQREKKVSDSETMPGLLMLLRDYASDNFSYREVADRLNASGYRTQNGRLLTGYAIRDILSNRFYEGKIIYHKGLPDEQVIDGCHEVPAEVCELWLRCQDVKKSRIVDSGGHPRTEGQIYPFSGVLKCHLCRSPYHGEAVHYLGHTTLRLTHERRTVGRNCKIKPKSRSVDELISEFEERVVSHIHLADDWKNKIIQVLHKSSETKGNDQIRDRLMRAKENLRKQHIWGDITDEEYHRERSAIENQCKAVSPNPQSSGLPNLERAAQLLTDLSTLFSHPGVTQSQRESFIGEVFAEITIEGRELISIEPKPSYVPLFATMLNQQKVEYLETKPPPSPP
jgi:DNA invertase Pin-like site-specific DNA recombinase